MNKSTRETCQTKILNKMRLGATQWRVTSEPPPSYSKVVGHSWTVSNDPASKKNGRKPPYQRPDSSVQYKMAISYCT